jgi:hypothetical protein
MFDEFIIKGREIVHKVDRTLTNRVVERRNMIISTKGGELALRVLWEFDLGRVFKFCELFVFLRFS